MILIEQIPEIDTGINAADHTNRVSVLENPGTFQSLSQRALISRMGKRYQRKRSEYPSCQSHRSRRGEIHRLLYAAGTWAGPYGRNGSMEPDCRQSPGSFNAAVTFFQAPCCVNQKIR